MAKQSLELKILDSRLGTLFPLPSYATPGSAAIDLRAMFFTDNDIEGTLTVNPGESVMIPTGIAYHINDTSLCSVLLPRSGLGSKSGIVLGNLVGLIDSDYMDEVKICCWNRSKYPFSITVGDRIAQMMFIPVQQVEFNIVEEFTHTSERLGGLGHSGVK